MTALGQWLVLLHILSAFALVAGLVGREFARAYALRQDELKTFIQLIGLSGWFENKLVIPGSNAVLVFGLLAAWVRGWPLLGLLQGSPINWLFVSLLLYLILIPMIIFVFLPRGKIFGQKLAVAQAQGLITREVRAAMEDPVVRVAHIVEALVILFIIYLMVMKPF